jgi:hypothetical protein
LANFAFAVRCAIEPEKRPDMKLLKPLMSTLGALVLAAALPTTALA